MSKSYISYIERNRKIHVKEFDHETKRSQWRVHEYAPKLFVPTKEQSKYTSIDDQFLERIEFKNISAARDFIKELGEVARSLYGYRKFDVQFICESDYVDANIDNFQTVFYDIETEVHDGFPDPTVAKEPINMITLIPKSRKQSYALTTCSIRAKELEEKFKDFNMKVEMFESEAEMLRRFIWIFSEEYKVDLFVGWNSEKFDMPYIANRIRQILGPEALKKLSPFGEVYMRTFTDDFGEEVVTAEITGVNCIDLLQYYRKFTHEPRESYSLDNIANVELGVGKLHHESGIPGHLLYRQYPTEGMEYNIIDVVRLLQIDETCGILELAVIVANMSKSNVADVIFSTRLWMNMIYDFLNKKDRYFEFRSERKPFRKIEGGFVACNSPGFHEYITSFDFASLYPSAMMALNISPDVKARKVPDVTPDRLLAGEVRAPEGLSMAGNGQCFVKTKIGFLCEILDWGYAKRKEYKALKLKYEKLEQEEQDEEKKKEYTRLAKLYKSYDSSIKTILNSCYGALAEKNFQFYDPDVAEAVTVTGQFMVRNLSRVFTQMLTKNYGQYQYVIANDTDSAYLSFAKAVEKQFAGKTATEEEKMDWLCKFADGPMKKIVRIANDQASNILSAFQPERFDADREAVARRGCFIKRKMYALALSDMEGVRYTKPKVKIVGLSAKKSSTPAFFRDKMKHFFEIFLGEGDTEAAISYMSEIQNLYREAKIEDIASNASVSDLTTKIEYTSNDTIFDDDEDGEIMTYGKGTHINAKAAIVHNSLIERDEKAREYIEPIRNGDKMKMLPLKIPNCVGNEKVIAWKDDWPQYYEDLGIRKYIDFETQFEKMFKRPLDRILLTCGINPEISVALDVF